MFTGLFLNDGFAEYNAENEVALVFTLSQQSSECDKGMLRSSSGWGSDSRYLRRRLRKGLLWKVPANAAGLSGQAE